MEVGLLFVWADAAGIIAIDDLAVKVPAILEVFMPGVHGAQAVAETLFGINNPGGKMPVTMYSSDYVTQVDFLNMSMVAGPGRSYRFYRGNEDVLTSLRCLRFYSDVRVVLMYFFLL